MWEEAFVPRNYWERKKPHISGMAFQDAMKTGNFTGMGLHKSHILGNLVEKTSASLAKNVMNAKVSSSKV